MIVAKTIGLALVLLAATAAHAQEDVGVEAGANPAARAADDGAFLPLTLAARVGEVRAFAFGSGGYDSSRRGPLVNSAVEVTIWGPIALRAQTTYSNDTSRMRPSLGARAQLLHQDRQGIDGSLSLQFKTEGFTETEGEIESVASIGRRWGRTYLLGNLAYGQDPEGNERDGEVRAAAFRRTGRFVLGFDSRARFALGTQHGRAATTEPRFDLMAGPVATLDAGPMAVFVETGPSAFELTTTDLRVGIAAFAGLAAAF